MDKNGQLDYVPPLVSQNSGYKRDWKAGFRLEMILLTVSPISSFPSRFKTWPDFSERRTLEEEGCKAVQKGHIMQTQILSSKSRRPAKQAPTIRKGKEARERVASPTCSKLPGVIKCFHMCTRKAEGYGSQPADKGYEAQRRENTCSRASQRCRWEKSPHLPLIIPTPQSFPPH